MGRALAGAEGAYLLIPPNYKAEDALEYGFRVGEALAGAVRTSGIPHVVLLSSVGAQHADGTGPIRSLHHAESVIGPTAKERHDTPGSLLLTELGKRCGGNPKAGCAP